MPFAGHRAPVVHSQPQLRPVRLGMPCPDPDVAVEAEGGLVVDPDDPRLTGLAPDRDLLRAARPRLGRPVWGYRLAGGEPLARLGVHPHRLPRLTLGRKAEPERADLGLEHSRS